MNDPDSSGAPLIWSVEPEADRPAERRPRRRWLYELPYLVIGAVVLGGDGVRRAPAADGPGSPVSPVEFLKHVDVEQLIGHDLLQPSVLPLQLLEPLGTVGFHTAVLGHPPVPGRLGDLQVFAHLGQALALPDQLLALKQLADDLLRRVPATRTHLVIHPPAPPWGIGLSQQVDPSTGTQSPSPCRPPRGGLLGLPGASSSEWAGQPASTSRISGTPGTTRRRPGDRKSVV